MSENFSQTDRERAVMQGEQIASADAYIDARPRLDGFHDRCIFEAGYERGWEAAMRVSLNRG